MVKRKIPGTPLLAGSDGHIYREDGYRYQPSLTSDGYLRVRDIPGIPTRQVGRLVCMAWHGDPPGPDYQCDHIDRDRKNNHPSNLRWVTPEQNGRNSNQVRGERQHLARLTDVRVMAIRDLYALGGYTYADLGRAFGVASGTIAHVVKNHTWTHVKKTA